MSRTFRRKNYIAENQTSWDRKGSKIAGFFTECDYSYKSGVLNMNFRVPTRLEYFTEFYRIHGDSRAGVWSPSWYYRNSRMRQNRQINRQELHKELRHDCEGKYEPNPRSCQWDWC